MMRTRLHFLLLGKTGEGKSATGNMIINRKVFKTSANPTSETKFIDFYFAEFGEYELRVVDGPGLEGTEIDKGKDRETAVKIMDEVLGMCSGGVDAFLLVIKLGNKFTEENKETLEALSQIYGVGFMKHVVVVVTGGDLFQMAVENEEISSQGFHEWCREQEGAFKELYKNCERRFVLFNNNERDDERKRAQIQEVVQLAQDLQKCSGRYTSDSFKKAEYEREKMILQLKAPQLRETFQEKICLLSTEIEGLTGRPSDDGEKKVLARVYDLRKEIELHDKGYSVLEELLEMMTNIEEHLHDKEKLRAIDKELEKIRVAKSFTGRVAAMFTGAYGAAVTSVTASVAGSVVGGALITGTAVVAAVAAPVAGVVAAVTALGGAAYFGVRNLKLNSQEKKMMQQREQLEKEMKPLVTKPQTHKK